MSNSDRAIDNTTTERHIENDNDQQKRNDSYATKALILLRSKAYVIEPLVTCYCMATLLLSKLSDGPNQQVDTFYTEEFCTARAPKVSNIYNISNPTQKTPFDKEPTLFIITLIERLYIGASVFMTVFLAAWSDRTGNRQALFIVPVLGDIVALCGFLFAKDFLHWPRWATKLIYCLPSAMSGGASVIQMGCYSYIADVIEPNSRTARMGVFFVFLLRFVNFHESIYSSLIAATSYAGIYAIILTFYVLALILACIGVRDVRRTEVKGTWYNKLFHFFHPRNVWDTVSLVITNRGHQLNIILLLILCNLIVIFMNLGGSVVLCHHLTRVMNMNVENLLQYQSVLVVTSLAGVLVTNKIFIKKLQVNDMHLGIIGTTCQIVSRIYCGLVSNPFWYYLGVVVNLFPALSHLVVNSLASKIVESDKIAKLYCLMNIMKIITECVVYKPITTSVYYVRTVSTISGSSLICCGLLTAPEIVIFMVLYILYKEREKRASQFGAEEKSDQDSEITNL